MRIAETMGMKTMRFEHVIANFNAVLVSGCTMRETSADEDINGRFSGALNVLLPTRPLVAEWLDPEPGAGAGTNAVGAPSRRVQSASAVGRLAAIDAVAIPGKGEKSSRLVHSTQKPETQILCLCDVKLRKQSGLSPKRIALRAIQ
jgi:hypothetical protein